VVWLRVSVVEVLPPTALEMLISAPFPPLPLAEPGPPPPPVAVAETVTFPPLEAPVIWGLIWVSPTRALPPSQPLTTSLLSFTPAARLWVGGPVRYFLRGGVWGGYLRWVGAPSVCRRGKVRPLPPRRRCFPRWWSPKNHL